MRILFLFFLTLPSLLYAQEMSKPKWNSNKISDEVKFVSAKLKVTSEADKVLFDDYKDASVMISCIDGVAFNLTIDVPDRFYLKDGEINTFTYKTEDNGTVISYNITSNNKMATVMMNYNHLTSEKPDFIVIVATDNYKVKPMKKISLVLYELKE